MSSALLVSSAASAAASGGNAIGQAVEETPSSPQSAWSLPFKAEAVEAGAIPFDTPVTKVAPALRPDADDIWIVEIRLRRRVVLLRDVLAYGDGSGEKLFVGISDLAAALDFPIEFYPETGRVSGWFLRDNQKFDYDTNTGLGQVAGREVRLPKERILIDDGELYLPLVILSDWLQLGAEWESSNQIISLDPAYLLPGEEAGRRASKAGGNLGNAPLLDVEALPRFEAPYRLIGWPHARVNLSATTRGARGFEVQGNAVLRGDLAFMAGNVFVSGTSAGNTNARATFSRSDPDQRLLGPLQASDLQLGALSLSQAPLIRQSTIGTGARLASQPRGTGETFSDQIIEGDATPGWQAELYRGNQLLGFQTIGADGRYAFADVPLQVGENRFTVRLYGPQGEQEEIERRFEIARNAVRPGQFTYLIEAIQPRRQLGLSDQDFFTPTGDETQGVFDPEIGEQGFTAQAQVGYGLAKELSVRGLLSYQQIKGSNAQSDLTFAGVGAEFSTLGALSSVDGIVSQSGEWALRGGLAFDLAGVSVFAEHEQYSSEFRSNANSFNDETILSRRSDIRLDGALNVPFLGSGLNWGASYSQSRFRGGRRFETASFRTSTAIKRIALANRIAWNRQFDDSGNSSQRMIGAASAAGTIGPVRIRAGIDYELMGDKGIRNWSLDAQSRVSDLAINLRYQRNQRSRSNTVSLGFSRDFAGIRLGANLRYDDFSGSVDGLLTLSFALDRNPISRRVRMGRSANSDRGLAVVSAFEDDNANGQFDDGENALEGFGLIAEPRGRVREDGKALVLSNFAVDRLQAIALDGDALEDPFAIPSTKGVAVVARPGSVAKIALPVIQSGEIEYTALNEEGEPIVNAILELVSVATGTRYRERSAYDGLVLFQRVPPGKYTLKVPEKPEIKVELLAGETLLVGEAPAHIGQ